MKNTLLSLNIVTATGVQLFGCSQRVVENKSKITR